MSWDFNVLATNLDDFEKSSFEEFCNAKGYTISIHPNTNLKENSGFLPFKIAGDFLPGCSGQDFLTGFEFYSNPVIAEQPPKSLFKRLFNKKPQPAVTAINVDKHDLALICSGSDLLEIFMAHWFGLYFAETQGCKCYDPQDAIEYKEPKQIEKTINDIIGELKARLSKGTLKLHIFEKWS